MVNESEIKALIDLLDDPDQNIQEAVVKRLSELGSAVIPNLEKSWENTINQGVQARLELIIQDLQYNDTENDLKLWINDGCTDLLWGVYLIARSNFPELQYDTIDRKIQFLCNEVEKELNPSLTPLEKIRILNHILFEIHKFSGNYSNYYASNNYYINQVLEMQKGSPIILAVIYISVCHKLGIPVYGVNLPKNFIVAYKNTNTLQTTNNILFYANPYNKGAILGRREIEYFLKQQNIEKHDLYFNTCSNQQIIERIVRNLISSYESTRQNDKIERLKSIIQIIENQ